MMRVFFVMGSEAKTPQPCTPDRLLAMAGSAFGFALLMQTHAVYCHTKMPPTVEWQICSNPWERRPSRFLAT